MTPSKTAAAAAVLAALALTGAGAQDPTRDSGDAPSAAVRTAMGEVYALAGAAENLSAELDGVMLASMAGVSEDIAEIAASLRAAADAKDLKAAQDATDALDAALARLQRAAPESVELQAKMQTLSRMYTSVANVQRALEDANRASISNTR